MRRVLPLVLMLSLTLAACGGGGGDDPSPTAAGPRTFATGADLVAALEGGGVSCGGELEELGDSFGGTESDCDAYSVIIFEDTDAQASGLAEFTAAVPPEDDPGTLLEDANWIVFANEASTITEIRAIIGGTIL